jgi:hypothetical protein
MNFKAAFSGFLMILYLSASSCKQVNTITDIGVDSINLDEPVPMQYMYDTAGVGLPIFYNMYLSVELSSLFMSSGAVFNQSLLNSYKNVAGYVTSSKKALNLGVYAVDLSYSKVFEQLDLAANYFNAMQLMSEDLGIPPGYLENTADRFEKNINEKDSLIKIANEVYMATDKYLKENERYGAAAQVIIGGWVEAVYIACDLAASTKDIAVIDRLAEQKFSLGNLISMLENYRDDEMIEKYIGDLHSLQPAFNKLYDGVQEGFGPVTPDSREITEYLVYVSGINDKITPVRSGIVK